MSEQITLFPNLEVPVSPKSPITHAAKPRLRSAERNQIEFKIGSLDNLISSDHKARYVVSFVEQLDLSKILSGIQSVDNGVGRPATDPKILLALWLFGVLERVISARTIAEFCSEHNAYQWICGGVSINHHTLSDFATNHGEQFDDFLTQSVAILANHGFVDLDNEDVAQDGMRVRASAGSSSFRREKTLKELHKDAIKYIVQLKAEHAKNPSACRSRQSAAALRAATDRERKIAESLKNMDLFIEEKEENLKKHRKKLGEKKKQELRVSTTDPEARVMKMPSGGFRPAFNVQFATTTIYKIIIGVSVNNQGTDAGLIEPMAYQIKARCGRPPNNILTDTSYTKYLEIDSMAKTFPSIRIFMPVKATPNSTNNPHSPSPDDSKPVGDWKIRMGTHEAKDKYKLRSATAEFSNAQARNKGLQQMPLRGIKKVNIVACLFALVHNMQRFFSLMKAQQASMAQ